MAKSFGHSSLNRDLPMHHRRDPPRMGPMSSNQQSSMSGLGRMGPSSSRISSLLDIGSSSKLGQSGSRGMMSSGPSSQGLPSIFSLGSRGPPPISSQPSREPDNASKILASFGLSSSDLDELSRYPEEKITAENLPQIIQHLKRRREDLALLSYRERLSRDPVRSSSDDWDDLRALKRDRFDDRPSSLDPIVDYDHGDRSRDISFRDRLDIDERLRDRERLRDDRFLSDSPFRKLDSDYDRLGFGSSQERPVFEKRREMPTGRMLDDIHGLMPKSFPHICSVCDIAVHTMKSWNDHVTGRFHKKQCMDRMETSPEWNGQKRVGEPYMLQQSTNPAPGILGPPPPPFSVGGGAEGRHGNFRGPMGDDRMGPRPMPGDDRMGPRPMPGDDRMRPRPMPGDDRMGLRPMPGDDRMGPRQMLRKGTGGRVVHIMEFERGKNLKFQLLKLAEPFGTVTNCLILNKINEAFIEMSTTEEAEAIVEYYNNNTPLVYGKPVGVHMSQKYKRIKKPDGMQGGPPEPRERESKPEVKGDTGRVIHLSNLPSSVYTDNAVIKLAENYGKVKTYILMRMRNQAFIEMERAEDAQNMVEHCARTPLYFQGKDVKVGLSQRYKKLVLRIPNNSVDKLKDKNSNRKRAHSPDKDSKDSKEKQKKSDPSVAEEDADKSSQVVTTEDTDATTEEADQKDLVSGSCEPELVETEEDESAALLETSSSVGDEAEVPDVGDLDQKDESQNEAQKPLTSTPAPITNKKKGFAGNLDDFVTLDEVGGEDDPKPKSSRAATSVDTLKRESSVMTSSEADASKSQVTPESESAAEIGSTETEYELGPYQPNNPVGVEYVIPKTGFYCKLCSLFYTSEDVAKVSHCSTLAHYQKLKKILNKPCKTPEKKN